MKTFGEILKAQRRKLGLTQKQVADSIGMSDAYICKLEGDKIPPPPYYTVADIARVLGIDAEQLWKVALRHREKQALERSRRKAMNRRRVAGDGGGDSSLQQNSDVSEDQINAFFARTEVRITTFGLFHKQPEELTIEEKRIVYQAISELEEILGDKQAS